MMTFSRYPHQGQSTILEKVRGAGTLARRAAGTALFLVPALIPYGCHSSSATEPDPAERNHAPYLIMMPVLQDSAPNGSIIVATIAQDKDAALAGNYTMKGGTLTVTGPNGFNFSSEIDARGALSYDSTLVEGMPAGQHNLHGELWDGYDTTRVDQSYTMPSKGGQ